MSRLFYRLHQQPPPDSVPPKTDIYGDPVAEVPRAVAASKTVAKRKEITPWMTSEPIGYEHKRYARRNTFAHPPPLPAKQEQPCAPARVDPCDRDRIRHALNRSERVVDYQEGCRQNFGHHARTGDGRIAKDAHLAQDSGKIDAVPTSTARATWGVGGGGIVVPDPQNRRAPDEFIKPPKRDTGSVVSGVCAGEDYHHSDCKAAAEEKRRRKSLREWHTRTEEDRWATGIPPPAGTKTHHTTYNSKFCGGGYSGREFDGPPRRPIAELVHGVRRRRNRVTGPPQRSGHWPADDCCEDHLDSGPKGERTVEELWDRKHCDAHRGIREPTNRYRMSDLYHPERVAGRKHHGFRDIEEEVPHAGAPSSFVRRPRGERFALEDRPPHSAPFADYGVEDYVPHSLVRRSVANPETRRQHDEEAHHHPFPVSFDRDHIHHHDHHHLRHVYAH